MPIYSIKAITNDGQKVNKTVSFEDEEGLYNYIETTGLNVLSIKERPSFYKYIDPKNFFRSIKKTEVIEILSNMQIIVKSGLPTKTGIEDLAKDSGNPAVSDMLSDMAFQLQNGVSLSGAMSKYPKIFDKTTLGLVKIGEETGTLDKTLLDAANNVRRIQELISKTKVALMYPVMAFILMIGALSFWLISLMPKIFELFSSFGMKLPALTLAIKSVSDFLRDWILLILVVIFVVIALIVYLRKKWFKFRFMTDKLLLKLPIAGSLVKNFNLAFFAEYVRLMIGAGLPLYQALTIIDDSMSNTVFKEAINKTKISISSGATFSQGLKATDIFTAIIVRMLNVGEQTGRLEEQLTYIADYYYEKVNYLSQNIAKFIEPIIIVGMGGMMVIIMLGMLGPIYGLISGIQQ